MNPELLVAVVAGLVAIASAVIAYMAQISAAGSQAQVTLIQSAAQQAHERQKPFVELQMKYYFEAAETAAQIPRTVDETGHRQLVARFWQLYWGPLAVVEDEDVEKAMVIYGLQLGNNPDDAAALEKFALGIAHACRGSLKRLWVPELGNIRNIRTVAQ